jgi:hypothetical protein
VPGGREVGENQRHPTHVVQGEVWQMLATSLRVERHRGLRSGFRSRAGSRAGSRARADPGMTLNLVTGHLLQSLWPWCLWLGFIWKQGTAFALCGFLNNRLFIVAVGHLSVHGNKEECCLQLKISYMLKRLRLMSK